MITIVKRFKTKASRMLRNFGECDAFRVTGDCTPTRHMLD